MYSGVRVSLRQSLVASRGLASVKGLAFERFEPQNLISYTYIVLVSVKLSMADHEQLRCYC
jgi:hypothetical protein